LITLLHRGWKVPVENMTAKYPEFVEDLRPATGVRAQKGIEVGMGLQSMEMSASARFVFKHTRPRLARLSTSLPALLAHFMLDS
jgi:hypothetical protein